MGLRGPKTAPTPLKRLRGNPGRRPLPKNEPKPGPAISIEPPDWLLPAAKVEWARMVPELVRLGVFKVVDPAALEGYCQSRARWIEYEALTDLVGLQAAIQFGYRNAAVRERLAMLRFAAEFGATPASRSRVTGNPQEPEDPFAEFGELKVMDGGKP